MWWQSMETSWERGSMGQPINSSIGLAGGRAQEAEPDQRFFQIYRLPCHGAIMVWCLRGLVSSSDAVFSTPKEFLIDTVLMVTISVSLLILFQLHWISKWAWNQTLAPSPPCCFPFCQESRERETARWRKVIVRECDNQQANPPTSHLPLAFHCVVTLCVCGVCMYGFN